MNLPGDRPSLERMELFSPPKSGAGAGRTRGFTKAVQRSLDINGSKDHNQNSLQLTAKEKKLLELIHNTRFGEIRLAVEDGQPVLAEEVKRSIKL